MNNFIEYKPSNESYWRSIILFGQNVASYKFALAQALIEISSKEKTFVRLDELAEPYVFNILKHLRITDKQGTSHTSIFLDACRAFNENEITREKLIAETVRRGFANVIDAFHIVNQSPIPTKFFIDERASANGIRITDELFKLKETPQFANFPFETEARWRLVETAWSVGVSAKMLEVKHDEKAELMFFATRGKHRINITSSRDALNGYQKGKCFYCFANILIESRSADLAEVDHFFPHTLVNAKSTVNLNGVWNLVLACQNCNRGTGGKSARIPALKYLERLHTRNSFLIESHHPLRETLIQQTGKNENERRKFLQSQYDFALGVLIHTWQPHFENEAAF